MSIKGRAAKAIFSVILLVLAVWLGINLFASSPSVSNFKDITKLGLVLVLGGVGLSELSSAIGG